MEVIAEVHKLMVSVCFFKNQCGLFAFYSSNLFNPVVFLFATILFLDRIVCKVILKDSLQRSANYELTRAVAARIDKKAKVLENNTFFVREGDLSKRRWVPNLLESLPFDIDSHNRNAIYPLCHLSFKEIFH